MTDGPLPARSSSSRPAQRELVLVTGGAGYVGGWCVVRLLQAGYAVRATLRKAADRAAVVRAAVSSQGVDPAHLSFAVADLRSEEGWERAMAGVSGVLHVASPVRPEDPKDPLTFALPAVTGTQHVLAAAWAAGVGRVVVTSSAEAAVAPDERGDRVHDEATWTDANEAGLSPYRRAKTLAEKATWEFGATHPDRPELVTILPGTVLGPTLPGLSAGSTEIVTRMMRGRVPAYPKAEFGVVDVRDLASLHVLALTEPLAPGERFLAAAGVTSFGEVAGMLRSELRTAAWRVPVLAMPDEVVRQLARVDDISAALVPMLGRHTRMAGTKARDRLGWRVRPVAETVIDTARDALGVRVDSD